MPQESRYAERHEQEAPVEESTARKVGSGTISAAAKEETDAILDLIDEIFEEEGIDQEEAAQEYVNSFRQLGGQ